MYSILCMNTMWKKHYQLYNFLSSQGKSEFIGRAMAKPVVKMKNESYDMPKFPPKLEWWDIYRGPDKAGQLLACFELLQVD